MAADNLTAKLIADLRMRLLDLRNGNKLLSYKHSERAKTHIDALLAASNLAIDIRSRFAGMGEPERSLRRFFVEADTWSTFRKSSGEPRPIDEISTPELRVLGLLALNDHRSSTEDVLVVMSRIAGLQRLRAASRERLDRAYKEARLNASQTSEIRPHLALLGGHKNY